MIGDALVELGRSMGKDVKVCPCQTIVPLYRNHVFAEIKPSTRTRIDFGFALGDTKATGRLVDTGGFQKKNRITHRIPITSVNEIDAEVKKRDLDRRIEHDARRLVAVIERGGIDERLEGRARLPARLRCTVELAQREREAADARQHASGVRIHDDDATADLGDLHERPDALRLVRVLGRDVDDIADIQHVAGARLLAGLLVRPLDFLVGHLDGLTLGDETAVLLALRAAR